MGTAYASFTSLRNLIIDLHEHPHPPIKLDDEHVDSLNSNICFFRRFLELHHKTIDSVLEIRLADAAHAAEDLIETHIADRVPDFYGSFQRVIDGMDLIRKQVKEMNLNEQRQGNSLPKRHPPAPSQSPSAIFDEDTVVGLEGHTSGIVGDITREDCKTEMIIIAGMAGIGKTTLARKVYGHPLIKQHFDVVAWAEIAMDSTTEHILIQLLHSLLEAENTESLLEWSKHKLGEKLYECLESKKYLIVLDNVHDQVWRGLKDFFPHKDGGQIIMMTARAVSDTYSSIPVSVLHLDMDLLDEHNSWKLFCQKVFGKGSCPSELVDVGKMIATNCEGLPLSICVIGEHLAVSQRTPKYWEHVADNTSSLVFSLQNEESLKRLSTSYTRLPVHLKPCFLYMGIFPENEEIDVYKLTRLWVAEGFIDPISSGGSLEETAERYLDDLIERNLILRWKCSRWNILKTCKIHGLLRHLCIKESPEKKFFHLALKIEDLRAVENERRIVRRDIESEGGHSLPYYNASRSRALRTFMFEGELSRLKDKELLRVLAPVVGSSSFLLETFADIDQLVNIRYFDPSIPFLQDICFPSSVCLLWNLQYLVFDVKLDRVLPQEIWKMARLRGVKMRGLFLPHPPIESNDIIMKNLHSAQTLLNFNLSREAVKRIPNVKKLKLRYDDRADDEFLDGIDRLKNLESLGCFFDLSSSSSSVRIRNVSFPESLVELNVSHLRLEDVTDKFGSLPKLKVLKLRHCEGSEWELVEGQFRKLELLQLSHCRSLRYFKADDTRLERLVLERLDHLEGINLQDFRWLKSIEVYSCPDSAVILAVENADLLSRQYCTLVVVTVRLLKESALSESSISANYALVDLIK